MSVKYYLRGHARKDIAQIRRYTLKNWGERQWSSYESAIRKKLQSLAENPELGIVVDEVSPNSFRFPIKDHVVYYHRKTDGSVVFVGIVPSNRSPEAHLRRQQDLRDQFEIR